MLVDVSEVLCNARMAPNTVTRTTDRPVQNHATDDLGMGHGESQHRATTHAAAEQVCAVLAEMLEQALALSDVIVPRDRLDAPAGLTGLATIEDDAAVRLWQMLEQLDARVDAERRPFS